MKVSDTEPQAYTEIVKLFASGPRPEEIVTFRPSPATQERVRELLTKSSEGSLTEEERAELDLYSNVEHLMRLVKAHARAHLKA